jgi:hypothetical protein
MQSLKASLASGIWCEVQQQFGTTRSTHSSKFIEI